jgi:hypothetical protein
MDSSKDQRAYSRSDSVKRFGTCGFESNAMLAFLLLVVVVKPGK